jgi:hypothetical protein
MLWLLKRLANRVKCPFEFLVAWDVELTDAFLDTFPEALKSTCFYTLGAPSVPMLNRAAKRARGAGYLRAGVIGNQEARSYNQRTWCRTWSLTAAGREVADCEPTKKEGP